MNRLKLPPVGSLLLWAFFLLAGAGIGYWFSHIWPVPPDSLITREGGYEFVNPLLSCDISEDVPYSGFEKLKNALTQSVSDSKNSGAVERMSVYFRDLDRGRWTGVNVDDTYIPASLNKLPPMIAWLKVTPTADLPRVMLSLPKQNPFPNEVQHYPPAKPLDLGKTYSLQTLLESMIEESDNNAAYTLYDTIATSTLSDVYESFNVPSPASDDEEILSPKMFSRFLRILYNASYLGRVKSQTALKMMAQTNFSEGLAGGLPGSIVVSHKFGERTISDPNGGPPKVELHDCGIVYYPRIPYVLCVMTEGDDFASLEQAIQNVSRTTYDSVQRGLIVPENLSAGE